MAERGGDLVRTYVDGRFVETRTTRDRIDCWGAGAVTSRTAVRRRRAGGVAARFERFVHAESAALDRPMCGARELDVGREGGEHSRNCYTRPTKVCVVR